MIFSTRGRGRLMGYDTIIGKGLGFLCTETSVEPFDSFDGTRENDTEFVCSVS